MKSQVSQGRRGQNRIVIAGVSRRARALTFTLAFAVACGAVAWAVTQTNITGPSGSVAFGTTVTVLSNGNFVVTDPSYSIPAGAATVGAVYLYNGATMALISTLTGGTASDQVGSGGVTALTNGNFVVRSPFWDKTGPAVVDVGAVTWVSGTTGVSGVVSSTNSLVGSTLTDSVGNFAVTVLTSSSNYVVRSSLWNIPSGAADVGAVTWGSGTTGVSGAVSLTNSLVGSSLTDTVGNFALTLLTNGNYVVRSSLWNGTAADVGAVTWGSGTTGVSGVVSSANSLVGSTASDGVGGDVVIALTNGNYVVRSPVWDRTVPSGVVNVGAATWGSGTTGVTGTIGVGNSLIGSTLEDRIGVDGILALTNGSYVVRTSLWNNGATADAGAVTWGSGTTGVIGAVSSANSLVGSTASDSVGGSGVTALTNGNYVVRSILWNNGATADTGAVTWGSGTAGVVGAVAATNSLVGSTATDSVGSGGVTALTTNGNYVVASPLWNSATADVGAVTWGDGAAGATKGAVAIGNSLIGSTVTDSVGNNGVTALTNGNYVVSSLLWNNGATADTGAVTWGSGTAGVAGAITSSNSLVGSTASDGIGFVVTALTSGNYVVASSGWDNGAVNAAGAVTWGSGTTGITGAVSSSNSLVGSATFDSVGSGSPPVFALSNGNYVVVSPIWNNGAATSAGAATWGNGTTGISGAVSSSNSLVGSTASDNVGNNGGITTLSNGNYLVRSFTWDNGAFNAAGAVTWGNGIAGVSGAVSASNSLVGSTAGDQVGFSATALSNGNYVVRTTSWDNGAVPATDAGAVTLGAGNSGTVGTISATNSVLGTAPGGGGVLPFAADTTVNEQLVVGRPGSNTVSRFRPTHTAIANGNWSTSTTWDYGTFTKPVDVSIPSPRSITLDTDPSIISLSVVSGATLTVPTGRTLTVTGDATISGTLANSGTVSVGGTTAFTGGAPQNVPALTSNNLTINNSTGSTLTGNVSITGVLTLTNGTLSTGSNTLSLGVAGTISGASTARYIIGNLKKDYNATGSFTYPSGTANGYSPVNVTITTLTVNPSSLTVKAVQGPHPQANPGASLKRYWTLTESGNLTANLTFNYLDPTDIAGTEALYQIFKIENGFVTSYPNNCPSSPCVTPAANTAIINGVSSFSDWTAAAPNAVTAVELVSFTAVHCRQGTLLEWQTGYEADNLGFNIYREEDGNPRLVTKSLIAGSALISGSTLTSGNSYSWTDRSANSGARYWLEDVDLDGTTTWHGPIVASDPPYDQSEPLLLARDSQSIEMVGSDSSQLDLSAPVSRKVKTAKVTTELLFAQAAVAASPSAKISLKQEGWYRVTQAELTAAGFNVASPQYLQLFTDGKEQPFILKTDKGGSFSIEFYGVGVDTTWTNTRVYWLVNANAPGVKIRSVQEAGSGVQGRSFQYTAERRDRNIYYSALKNGDAENFFGPVVTASGAEQAFTLRNVDPDMSKDARVEVRLQGVTLISHEVRVLLNGVELGTVAFNGQDQGVGNFTVSQSVLKEGDNRVSLRSILGSTDVNLGVYTRVTFWHSYKADNGGLRFTANAKEEVTVEGFNSEEVRVVDVTNSSSPLEVVGSVKQQDGSYSITLVAPGSGERTLMAFSNDTVKRPVAIRPDQPSSLRQKGNGADLVIITTQAMKESLAPLKALRQSQKLSVAIVDVEDIYDEFSFGHKTPQSIKDFLSFARTNWGPAPRFVLLAGDATYDPKNYMGGGELDLVPTKFVSTVAMEAPSDDWFADFDNDGLAEMAVGRLSVRTPQEAAIVVGKIVSYDRAPAVNSALLVNDWNVGYNFQEASQTMRSLIPATTPVVQVDRVVMDDTAAKTAIIDNLNRGPKLVNFLGHGSRGIWNGNLFTYLDAQALRNRDQLSVYLMMTCYNGAFYDVTNDSLAELLLKNPDGGAVAAWASSGMTEAAGQASMNQALIGSLFNPKMPTTIGEAIMKAKSATRDSDVRATWILFGDPSMKLR